MTRNHRDVFGRHGDRLGVENADFAADVTHHDGGIVVTTDVTGFETGDFAF